MKDEGQRMRDEFRWGVQGQSVHRPVVSRRFAKFRRLNRERYCVHAGFTRPSRSLREARSSRS